MIGFIHLFIYSVTKDGLSSCPEEKEGVTAR